MPLSTTRTTANTPAEHVSDHNLLHAFYNAFEGFTPSSFALASHNHTAAQTTSGVFSTARLGTGTATNLNFLRGDGTWNAPVASAHTHPAADIVSGVLATARLGTGTATNLNFLRGDGTWNAPVAAAHTHDTSDIVSGTMSPARLGTGTASSTNFLRGDGTWQAVTALAVTSPIGVPLSSFSGANDDQRLANYDSARRTAGSGLHGYPVVLDQSRVYTFNQQLVIDDGFAMIGGVTGTDQARSEMPVGTRVNIRLGGSGVGWLALPPQPQCYGVRLQGISFDGTATQRVFALSTSCQLWTSNIRDCSMQNMLSFMGTAATAQPVDDVTIDGFCNWNNIFETGVNWGGSDCSMVPSKMLIDANPVSTMGPNGYLMRFSSQSKTDISGWYMTCDQHSGILLSNSNNMLQFSRMFIEGRNASTPCFGALVRNSTHYTTWRDCWFAYAMTAPASGPNASDLGYVHCTNGTHAFIDCHTRLANSNTPNSTSTIYATGSNTHIIVRNMVGEGNGTAGSAPAAAGQQNGVRFTPRVRVVGGATADVDSSVTLVTS